MSDGLCQLVVTVCKPPMACSSPSNRSCISKLSAKCTKHIKMRISVQFLTVPSPLQVDRVRKRRYDGDEQCGSFTTFPRCYFFSTRRYAALIALALKTTSSGEPTYPSTYKNKGSPSARASTNNNYNKTYRIIPRVGCQPHRL